MSFNSHRPEEQNLSSISEGELVAAPPMTTQRIAELDASGTVVSGQQLPPMTQANYSASSGRSFLDRSHPLVAVTENDPDTLYKPQGFFGAFFSFLFRRRN